MRKVNPNTKFMALGLGSPDGDHAPAVKAISGDAVRPEPNEVAVVSE